MGFIRFRQISMDIGSNMRSVPLANKMSTMRDVEPGQSFDG